MSERDEAGAASLREDVRALLRAGDLPAALGRLDGALRERADPELRLMYGQLAHFACDFATARAQLEEAFAAFQAAGSRCRAAVAASSLARVYLDGWGNRIVGSAWLRRAACWRASRPA